MARIRTIKPEFWTSDQIAECSPIARLLFVGLWNFCDDGGIHPANFKRLKMEVFPGDAFTDSEMRGWVEELLSKGLLVQYEVCGEGYWKVTGWHHQKVDRPHLKYPDFDDHSTIEQRTDDDHSTPKHPRKGMEGKVLNPLPLSEKGEWLKSQILKVPNFVLSPPSPEGIEDLVRDFAPRYNGQFELNVKNAVTWALSPENRYGKKPDKAGCGVGFVRKWLTSNLPPETRKEEQWKRL